MPTQSERLATVETKVSALHVDVAEIKSDVKTLLAAHNRQTGAAKLVALIWGGLLALGGILSGVFFGGHHS